MHNLDLHVTQLISASLEEIWIMRRNLFLILSPSLLVFISCSPNVSLAVPSQPALYLNREVIQQHSNRGTSICSYRLGGWSRETIHHGQKIMQMSHVSSERERKKIRKLQSNHVVWAWSQTRT